MQLVPGEFAIIVFIDLQQCLRRVFDFIGGNDAVAVGIKDGDDGGRRTMTAWLFVFGLAGGGDGSR
jgi:hypothetical protein